MLRKVSFSKRCFSTSNSLQFKVAVIGAAGGIGQPLSLLLKLNQAITELTLHDVKMAKGVAVDVSHICTKCKIKGFEGKEMEKALECAHVVIVAAGKPRSPGMTRDQLFDSNAEIARTVALAASKACPKALMAFITNPVNSIVPIVAETLKAKKTYDPKRLFGVTSLDIVRSRTFIGEALKIDPRKVKIPVIGGHSGTTILPIFSRCKPKFKGDECAISKLIKRIQEAGTEVVQAKGNGSATLSMAFAAASFTNSLLRGLAGKKDVVDYAYVESDATDARFFSTPLIFGKHGISKNKGLPKMKPAETEAMCAMLPELKANIKKGEEYAKKKK